MDLFTLENPIFVTYAVAAALAALKVMGQGWVTVVRMMSAGGGFAAPEDLRAGPLNRDPRPEQLAPNEAVERSRRMHRNDLENIPAFWAAGLLFVAVEPPLVWAWVFMGGFVAARALHAVAYATAQRHEVRATFWTVGSLAVIAMAVWVLVVALAGV